MDKILKKYFKLTILILVFIPVRIFAGGQAEQLLLNVDPQQKHYLSPGIADGNNDTITIPFGSAIDIPSGLNISGYEFNVFDITGTMVYQQSEKQTEKRSKSGRVRYSGSRPTIPDAITWNGVGDDDSLLPEGEYTYQLVFYDSAGQKIQSPPFALQIDNTAPVIDAFPRPRNALFSPNDDGIRDTVTVYQSGSRELLWDVQIYSESRDLVYSTSFQNASPGNSTLDITPPEEFEWNGKDASGEVVPDGYYQYVLVGRDRAGNETQAVHPRSIIVSQNSDLVLFAPQTGEPAFSPNNDGLRDTLMLRAELLDEEKGDNWSLVFTPKDNPDETLYFETGVFPVREDLALDGSDSSGAILPDGEYVAIFTVYDGTSIVSESFLDVVIDTVAPRATLALQTAPLPTTRQDVPFTFGGERRSHVVADIQAESNIDWSVILTSKEEATYEFSLQELGLADGILQVNWFGEGPDGTLLPDSIYNVRIEGSDAAGNKGTSRLIRVQKDTRLAEIGVELEKDYVGGPENRVPIRLSYEYPESIDEFLLEIRNAAGNVVYSSYKRNPFSILEWAGFTNSNYLVDEGEYFVSLQVKYFNGHYPVVEGVGPIIADLTPPEVYDLSAPYRVFSPNGDSLRDTITINHSVENTGNEWTGEIRGAGNTVIRTFSLGVTPEEYVWDGRDDNDRRAVDGDYLYVLQGYDVAGNRAEKILPIIVDTGSLNSQRWTPQVGMEVGPQPFSPDGDGENDELNITLTAEQDIGISDWSINIIDQRGEIFYTQEGQDAPNTVITWDGLNAEDELLQPADTYTVQLLATDVFGNIGTVERDLETGIFLERLEDGRLRIRIASIYFGGYLSDFLIVNEEQLQANLKTVRTLARILNKYDTYSIGVAGYAAHLLYGDEQRRGIEQREVLLPLSRARAENVRRALIILGVDRNRMSTQGFGGDDPIVPHTDVQNRWKNRRVEFILDPTEE